MNDARDRSDDSSWTRPSLEGGRDAGWLDAIGGLEGLRAITDAIVEAGAFALSQQREIRAHTRQKPDQSPVTIADEGVEARLREFLLARFPAMGFEGEETGTLDRGAARWVLDPIDGTRAFIRGMNTWSTLLALVCDDQPVVAFAAMPAKGVLYYAAKGHGAYSLKRGATPDLREGRLRVSTLETSLSRAMMAHGALSQFAEPALRSTLLRVSDASYSQRGFCDFANYEALLLGQVDVVLDASIQPYDVAAPALLVEEAGGAWSDFWGHQNIREGTFLATNGALHAETLAVIAAA